MGFFKTMLGTHNSTTYLPLKKWYLYPFNFIAKCQSKSIEEQYKKGVRLFDIRISYDKNDIPEFRHGLISYKGDVYSILDWLNSQLEPVSIRLILEENKANMIQDILFIKECERFLEIYPNLTFYEGRRKYDWHQLVPLPTLNVTQLVGSMQGNKIWPWLYAKLYNKSNLEKFKNEEYILIDFI